MLPQRNRNGADVARRYDLVDDAKATAAGCKSVICISHTDVPKSPLKIEGFAGVSPGHHRWTDSWRRRVVPRLALDCVVDRLG